MNISAMSRWKIWIPHLMVIFWLIYMGIAIWQHAMQSVDFPLYDPLSYMQKAMNFWHSVEQGRFSNPLNIEQSVRPPGTILMSYPLGFSPDFHWFYFRSIFLPIVFVIAAVYMVAGMQQITIAGWQVACTALLLGSLPEFYHLDWNEALPTQSGWGMVDNFQAGVAAMAAAAFVRSLMERNWRWLVLGSSLAAFTLLIKPSGLMIMGLLALTWLMSVSIEWQKVRNTAELSLQLKKYVSVGGATIFVFFSCVAALSVFSQYLSIENIHYGKQALLVMREVLQISVKEIVTLLHQTTGVALVLWLVIIGGQFKILLLTSDQRKPLQIKLTIISCIVIWSAGAWYWMVAQAGESQVRYFYPFLLMGCVYFVPFSLYVWSYSPRLTRQILAVLCILPAVNMGVLLTLNSPPNSWQRISGVTVGIGKDNEAVTQAYALIEDLRKDHRNKMIYSFTSSRPHESFENVGTYEYNINPSLETFHVLRPQDWLHGFVVRTSQMIGCDYILINKSIPADDITRLLNVKNIDNFELESTVFQAWLSTLNEDSGLKVVSDGHKLRLLQVINRKAFERAIGEFVTARSWRHQFKAENPPVWWDPQSVFNYTKNIVAHEIKFSDIYLVHAISINYIDKQIKIEVWWEELRHEEENNHRFMFFHLLDSSENIIGNQQVAVYPYMPLSEDHRWRYGSVTFDLLYTADKLASLAFGIYQPTGEFLMPDKGATDWDGRRVLIPIKPIIESSSNRETPMPH